MSYNNINQRHITFLKHCDTERSLNAFRISRWHDDCVIPEKLDPDTETIKGVCAHLHTTHLAVFAMKTLLSLFALAPVLVHSVAVPGADTPSFYLASSSQTGAAN
jgi:hypothetical protein